MFLLDRLAQASIDSPHTLPIRIAHVVGKMVGGGLEATVLNYYRHIDRSKIQYDFLIDSDSTYIPDEIEKLGGRIYLIPPYQHQIQYQTAIYNIIKENQYQLVYSHINTLSVFPLFAAWRAGVPIRVAHNHSTSGKGEFKKNLIKYTLRPFSKLFATTLCACSFHAGEWLFGKRTLKDGRITIWKNAVEINKFLYSEEKRKKIRKELQLENNFVISHVGRFIHQKNHLFLLDIFCEIYKCNPSARLLLVGTGILMPSVKEKVNKLHLKDVVIFTGNRTDIDLIYQAMDVFIMPSFYEGLGMAAIEAQIAGLPVICSDQVPPETRICDNFFYHSLNEPTYKWAQTALMFCTNNHLRKNMRCFAVNAGYDIEKSAEEMTEWYCTLLNIRYN